jgi:GntR family transcriptional regulator
VFIEIDPSLPQPLFEQVAFQIKFAIAAGTVRVNEMIPSVRELARQRAINPNTVVRAYRLLQDEEVLIPRRGLGLVVAEHSQAACQKQRKEFFRQRFDAFLEEAARSRLSQEELDEILQSKVGRRPPGGDR